MKGCVEEPVYMSRRLILAPVEGKGSYSRAELNAQKRLIPQAPW